MQLLRIDWNVIFTIVNLIVLYLGLRKFLIGPVTKVMDQRKQLLLRGLFAHPDRLAQHADLCACLFLVAYISGAGWIISDQDDAELRQPAPLRMQISYALPKRFPHSGRNLFSVDQLHVFLSFYMSTSLSSQMVTGPSFTSATCMSAPNSPVIPSRPRSSATRAVKRPYIGRETASGAALI